jgi:hypothetical protein
MANEDEIGCFAVPKYPLVIIIELWHPPQHLKIKYKKMPQFNIA